MTHLLFAYYDKKVREIERGYHLPLADPLESPDWQVYFETLEKWRRRWELLRRVCSYLFEFTAKSTDVLWRLRRARRST